MGKGLARIASLVFTGVLLAYPAGITAVASGSPGVSLPQKGDQNVCSPGGILTITSTLISCEITQSTPTTAGQANVATCIEQSSAAPTMTEICNITQANDSGDNQAIVQQDIQQQDTGIQSATHRATVTQTNSTGANVTEMQQQVDQSTTVAGDQTQFSDQGFNRDRPPFGAVINQQNGAGANTIDLSQSATQKEQTGDATIFQNQQAGETASINQLHTPVDAGPSSSSIQQQIDQSEHGPNPANQSQVADPHCCNNFEGNNVQVDGQQDVRQKTTPHPKTQSGLQQSGTNTVLCFVTPPTAGTCNWTENLNQNGSKLTTSCSTSSCTIGQQCTNGACAPCTPGEGGICPPPPCFVNCGAPIRATAVATAWRSSGTDRRSGRAVRYPLVA